MTKAVVLISTIPVQQQWLRVEQDPTLTQDSIYVAKIEGPGPKRWVVVFFFCICQCFLANASLEMEARFSS